MTLPRNHLPLGFLVHRALPNMHGSFTMFSSKFFRQYSIYRTLRLGTCIVNAVSFLRLMISQRSKEKKAVSERLYQEWMHKNKSVMRASLRSWRDSFARGTFWRQSRHARRRSREWWVEKPCGFSRRVKLETWAEKTGCSGSLSRDSLFQAPKAARENLACHISYEFWMPPTFVTLFRTKPFWLPSHEELCNTKLTCKRARLSVTVKSRTKQLFIVSYSGSRQGMLQLLQTWETKFSI